MKTSWIHLALVVVLVSFTLLVGSIVSGKHTWMKTMADEKCQLVCVNEATDTMIVPGLEAGMVLIVFAAAVIILTKLFRMDFLPTPVFVPRARDPAFLFSVARRD
ncbi:hypothetical protein HYW18_02505 [Candidatus Uhrbacteria bacterium]|nr:hypothetical protein [Candidatus Uhrbacteria bacterium]